MSRTKYAVIAGAILVGGVVAYVASRPPPAPISPTIGLRQRAAGAYQLLADNYPKDSNAAAARTRASELRKP